MKKVILLLFIVIGFMFGTNNVLALDDVCTVEEQARLRQLANATKVTYEFVEEKDTLNDEDVRYYNVTISNFHPDFYVYDEIYGTMFEYNGTPTVKVGRFYGGINYTLPFIASTKSPCSGSTIITKSISMIPYNEFSNDPLCVGHEKYELCKKFTPIRITSRFDFEQRMKKYINDLSNKEEPKTPVEEKEKPTFFDKIVEVLTDYYMYILVFIIVTGITVIIIVEVKKRRRIL